MSDTKRDIVERLHGWATDWNGEPMKSGEPPRDGLHCDELREAAEEIEWFRAENEKLRAALRSVIPMTDEISNAPMAADRWADRIEEVAREALGP